MDKDVSIVLSVESKNYRKLAQSWYNLTNEQMVGMDVHHNPPRHQGGRDIPEHLFVYHNTLHSAVHGCDSVLWCRKPHLEKDERGRSVVAVAAGKARSKEKDESGKSINAVKAAKKTHEKKDELGRSINALRSHSMKDEFGRSVNALKAGQISNSQKWEDPDNPELGVSTAAGLALLQKARGLPHTPKNRRKVVQGTP